MKPWDCFENKRKVKKVSKIINFLKKCQSIYERMGPINESGQAKLSLLVGPGALLTPLNVIS